MNKNVEIASNLLIAKIFLRLGITSFGGWSTLALLLEEELAKKRNLLSAKDIEVSTAYAQILPGATQVAMVASVGYKIKRMPGAIIATTCYLFPSLAMITAFSIWYFNFSAQAELLYLIKGTTAALCGIILANACRIGLRHASRKYLWAAIGLAFASQFFFHYAGFFVIISFGIIGLGISYYKIPKATQ